MAIVCRRFFFITGTCFISFLLSCGTTNEGRKFTLVDTDFNIKSGKSIAVINGHNDDNSINYAEMITNRISKSGKLKALSQAEITKKISRYPLNVDLIDFIPNDDSPNQKSYYISETSKKSIDYIQKQLNTDYILVVWVDQVFTMQNMTQRALIVSSRLISYPESKVIGYSHRYNENHSYCCFIPVNWNSVFNNSTDDLLESNFLKILNRGVIIVEIFFVNWIFLLFLIISAGCSIHNFINKEIDPNGKIAIIIADTRYTEVSSYSK